MCTGLCKQRTKSVIVTVNVMIDAASVIKPQHDEMVELALDGNIVALPENYNERVFQECIVNNMKKIPETIVIGSSRGMYLGTEVTGYKNLYNNCVSGACVEDYYALLGLYYEKFHNMPRRVIIETSPWIFYKDNPEARWLEEGNYNRSALLFYEIVNQIEFFESKDVSKENPYISLSYFRYSIEEWKEKGTDVFDEDAKISVDVKEAADYPDGSIRYNVISENESDECLSVVNSYTGACTYQGSDSMKEVDMNKASEYERLIDYMHLDKRGTQLVWNNLK